MKNRKTISLIILFSITIPILITQSFLLLSRFQYQSALTSLRNNDLQKAESQLKYSLNKLPFKQITDHLLQDRQLISVALGNLYFKRANQAKKLVDFLDELRRASYYFQQAVELNPLDIAAATRLARTVSAQQLVYGRLYPQKTNIYNANPLFERAITLRPNGIKLRYEYIKHLAQQQELNQLFEEVEFLISIYPSSFYQLRQETFYNKGVREAAHRGLILAVEKERALRDAYSALSVIAMEEHDLEGALAYYQEHIEQTPDKNKDGSYFQFGRLNLRNGKYDTAGTQFIKAVRMADDRDAMIRRVFSEYSSQKEYDSFVQFVKRIKETIVISELIDISLARSLAQADQVELAKARLKRIDNGQYAAESFYYLARIYEKEEDWDNMELSIQRATVLSPESSNYHALFARSLEKQKKYTQAENAVNNAIDTSNKSNRWLYNQRGWVRWRLKDYKGALEDWLKAVELEPERASFLHQVALAYGALGEKILEVKYAEKALEQAPANQSYLKHLERLQRANNGY